jgi:hypothetical protein
MSLQPRGVFRRFEPTVRLAFHRASERRLLRIKRHLESGSSAKRRPNPISWPPDPDPTRTYDDLLAYSRR